MLAAKVIVRRCLIGSLVQQLIADPVAEAADGLQRRPAERPVDLVAQAADVDVDDLGIALEGEVPDVLDELPPRQDVIRAAHQAFEERELGGVRWTLDPARHTSCRAGSSDRSPTRRTGGRSAAPRRRRARRRARSSASENGFARKSSAPTSRPWTRSSTASRAVTMS